MSKLRAPLKPWLEDKLPERDVQRIWRKLQAKPARAPFRLRLWQLSAAVAICLSAAALWALQSHEPSSLTLVGEPALAVQRRLGGAEPVLLTLSDGSQIRLERGAMLEVVDNSGREFSTRLLHGRAAFEVKPGGPRHWHVDCGALDVEVVGTGFSIDRTERGVDVHVLHGIVAVRGAHVPGGVQRLTAGQGVSVSSGEQREPQAGKVDGTRSLAAAESSTGAAAAAQPDARVDLGVQSTAAVAKPAAHVRDKARGGRAAAADGADINRMLQDADTARSAGDERRARELLSEVLRRAPEGRHAAVAAITLGRMQMAIDPLAAAASLRLALAAGPPADLREDTQARLVEAYARAGRRDLAQQAAAEYRAAFPGGRRTREVERWTAGP